MNILCNLPRKTKRLNDKLVFLVLPIFDFQNLFLDDCI